MERFKGSQDKKKNFVKNISRSVCLIIFILAGIFLVSCRKSDPGSPETLLTPAADVRPVEVTAKAGGSIPTKVPTITPTPLEGMESPLFCKMEMAMIHEKAEKLGMPGILIPDRYDQSAKTCSFILRGGKFLAEIGTLSTVHSSEEDFGVRIEIADKAGIVKNEEMKLWGTAALMALESGLSRSEAEGLMDTVTEAGTAAWDVYDLTLKEDPLTKTAVFSIFARMDRGQ